MANRRSLKRNINYICSDLFAECIAASIYKEKVNNETRDAILASILHVHSDFIRRISIVEPGMDAKKYFAVLIEDFNRHVSEIIDNIRNLG